MKRSLKIARSPTLELQFQQDFNIEHTAMAAWQEVADYHVLYLLLFAVESWPIVQCDSETYTMYLWRSCSTLVIFSVTTTEIEIFKFSILFTVSFFCTQLTLSGRAASLIYFLNKDRLTLLWQCNYQKNMNCILKK